MRFHIEKIYLWFGPDEKRCITFENNKVNVVRGNSSRGKSNLFAIIDYCLMSDKPNIVEPVINECTMAYGMEFVLNDTFYAVSRMKPESGTASQCVWLQHEPFKEGYYPNGTSNIKPFDLRRQLDLKSGLTEDYLYPWGKEDDKPKLVVSFRSFLMFNALTENIIASQYEFLNYKFFEDEYVDTKEKRAYLMDVLLGIDNVAERKQKAAIEELDSAKRSNKNQSTRYKNAVQKYNNYRKDVIDLLYKIESTKDVEYEQLSGRELEGCVRDVLKKFTPHQDKAIEKSEDKTSELSAELYKKKMLLFNIKRAQAEYQKYLDENSSIAESLKPVEYLSQHLSEYGVTIWGRHIIEELQTSLNKLRSKKSSKDITSFIPIKSVENLETEIRECENRLKALSEVKLKPIESSSLYLTLGQLKSLFPILREYYEKIPENAPMDYDYARDREIRDRASAIIADVETRRGSVVRGSFDNYIQEIYDSLSVKDNFEDCKTRYNRDKERLELSDGKSILNYNNIGSQSNYMYLHICFFLGMHNYLLDNPCDQIANFLFIDQPSVPYYENTDNAKSNDKAKLLDVFRVIDDFVKGRIANGNEFQIILIEHAEESYWTGNHKLETFSTRVNFDGDEALVPKNIIKKYRDENKY